MTKGNGAAGLIIPAIGQLKLAPTERIELGSVWIDVIKISPVNQLFRARLAKEESVEDALSMMGEGMNDFDEDGQLNEKTIRMFFKWFVHGWGSYDEDRNHVPLVDVKGDEVDCTEDNFVSVVRHSDGGAEMFFLLVSNTQALMTALAEKSASEKKASAPSGAQSKSGRAPSTRKGRKPAPVSTSSKPRRGRPRKQA